MATVVTSPFSEPRRHLRMIAARTRTVRSGELNHPLEHCAKSRLTCLSHSSPQPIGLNLRIRARLTRAYQLNIPISWNYFLLF